MEECCICFHIKPPVLLKPCNHTMCIGCLDNYLRFDIRCHMCRALISGSDPPLYRPSKKHYKVFIPPARGHVLGVSVMSANDKLIMTDIDKTGRGYNSGILEGDQIIAINTIPCYRIQHISSLIECEDEVYLYVRRTKPLPLFCCSVLRRKKL